MLQIQYDFFVAGEGVNYDTHTDRLILVQHWRYRDQRSPEAESTVTQPADNQQGSYRVRFPVHCVSFTGEVLRLRLRFLSSTGNPIQQEQRLWNATTRRNFCLS